MSQEKISCLISFVSPQTRKSPVSCLMKKSHVSQENLLSHHIEVSPMSKSHVSWDFLVGFIEKAWDMRISHETGDFLLRHETEDFLLGGEPKLIRHEIFSWGMRFSHETGDRRFSWWRGTQNWKNIRFSLGTWDILMRQETGDLLVWDGAKNLKDMRFSG